MDAGGADRLRGRWGDRVWGRALQHAGDDEPAGDARARAAGGGPARGADRRGASSAASVGSESAPPRSSETSHWVWVPSRYKFYPLFV